MLPISLCDILEIVPSSTGIDTFQITGINLNGKHKDNLVLKSYQLVKKDFDLPPVAIHLHKYIPAGAGLGGGSSNAASTIKLLNEIFCLNLSLGQMESYARMIGSDCAFFIRNKPVLAIHKGDHLSPINIDLKGYYLILVKPNIHINTPQAYSWIKPSEKESPLKAIIEKPIEEWEQYLINDFESAVFMHHPKIKNIKENLYDAGAIYASLTGSGAAVYGIFKNDTHLEKDFKDCFYWEGKI